MLWFDIVWINPSDFFVLCLDRIYIHTYSSHELEIQWKMEMENSSTTRIVNLCRNDGEKDKLRFIPFFFQDKHMYVHKYFVCSYASWKVLILLYRYILCIFMYEVYFCKRCWVKIKTKCNLEKLFAYKWQISTLRTFSKQNGNRS